MQKNNEYLILFVDPHGTQYTDIEKKIDYFAKIFEEKGVSKQFTSKEFAVKVKVKLLLKPAMGGIVNVGENYQKYWFDNFGDFATKLNN